LLDKYDKSELSLLEVCEMMAEYVPDISNAAIQKEFSIGLKLEGEVAMERQSLSRTKVSHLLAYFQLLNAYHQGFVSLANDISAIIIE
jgi:hypothetical protein